MNIDLKMDKKKIIVIASAVLVILLIIISLVIYKNKQAKNLEEMNKQEKVFVPEFMSAEEKAKLEIPADAKIQAVTRDANGEVSVYRVIKSDSDIVDPATVGPISPRTKKQ